MLTSVSFPVPPSPMKGMVHVCNPLYTFIHVFLLTFPVYYNACFCTQAGFAARSTSIFNYIQEARGVSWRYICTLYWTLSYVT